jgi:hypothetical protein
VYERNHLIAKLKGINFEKIRNDFLNPKEPNERIFNILAKNMYINKEKTSTN